MIPSSSRLFPRRNSPTPASHMVQYELHPVLTEYADILQCFCSLGNSDLFNLLRLHEEIHIHTTHCTWMWCLQVRSNISYISLMLWLLNPHRSMTAKSFFMLTILSRRHVVVFECQILPNLATQDFINHSMTDTMLC